MADEGRGKLPRGLGPRFMRYLSKSVTRVQERRKIIQCEKRTERIGSTRTTGYIVKQQEGISVWYA